MSHTCVEWSRNWFRVHTRETEKAQSVFCHARLQAFSSISSIIEQALSERKTVANVFRQQLSLLSFFRNKRAHWKRGGGGGRKQE